MAFGHCIACGRTFGFNPLRVPSSTALTGEREPVCEACMGKINALRRSRGLEPFAIAPDAYEPVEASEL